MQNIQFIDLAAQQQRIKPAVEKSIQAVLAHGQYIMGPEVTAFEEKLSAFGKTNHALSCSNGSDAILLSLMALEIGPGDAVFVPSFTFAATAEMVALTGATPVFVDVLETTFNMDPTHLQKTIEETRAGALKPRAVIAVDLFGQIANYPALVPITKQNNLHLIADAAQGFGATLNGQQAGEFADLVTTSFFPAKPLGCYGDGGAVLTNDDELLTRLQSLRNHGQGTDRYDNIRIGINGRLDSIQAAVLLLKLDIFAEEISARNRIAARYSTALKEIATPPVVLENSISTWAQYTIRTPERAKLAEALKNDGIPTAIYYARPLHRQTAYSAYPVGKGGLPVTEKLSHDVISLPMHPYLDEDTQDRIINAVKNALTNS